MTKKNKKVALEHRPYTVGALVPWGGDCRDLKYCEIHKKDYRGDSCPFCMN